MCHVKRSIRFKTSRQLFLFERDAVIAYCRGKLASFKLPRHVVFVEEFPMTASGKIRKTELRDQARQALGDRET